MKKISLILILSLLLFAGIGCKKSNDCNKNETAFTDLQMVNTLLSRDNLYDTERQLGLAIFLYQNGFQNLISCQYDKVLEIDPNNKAAWIIIAQQIYEYVPSAHQSTMEYWSRRVKVAKQRNLSETKICSYEAFYNIFRTADEKGLISTQISKDKKGCYIITDFNSARDIILQSLHNKEAEALDFINKAEQKDPNNAACNYFRAHCYFGIGEEKKAYEELEKAFSKPCYNLYVEQRKKAISRLPFVSCESKKLLERAWLPDIPSDSIWYGFLVKKFYDYEKKGDVENCRKILNLGLTIARQTQKEPYFSQWEQKFEKECLFRLEQLNSKIPK